MINLKELNKPQREAVQAYEGPVLVLAGAGSGKTRVITYRIAYLLDQGLARPWEILAVTFTNKAAAEMRQRVQIMLNQNVPAELYIGTFHAFGARFLRRHAEAFGRTARFTIYDEDDQKQLLRTLLKLIVGQEEAKSYLNSTHNFIEKVKCELRGPKEIAARYDKDRSALFCEIYEKYEEALRKNNAFDFDDLISLPCRLLSEDHELRETYRQRFRFLLIDEFQDTNLPQGEMARLLAAPSGNITAVGDDDQSIYGWRGAYIGNILQFEEDYKNVKTFRLEQNYRSTQSILDVAHSVIENNKSRHPKKLWTGREKGNKPVIIAAPDDREEALTVVSKILEISAAKKYLPGDVVILYRTNAQSRSFEDALRRHSLPYVIVGGLRFYERKEIKDFLAYLRLLTNANDVISVQRVINLPPRGIGQKTLERLHAYAASAGITLFQSILEADKIESLSKRSSENIQKFGRWIESLRAYAQKNSLFKVGERLLHESGLLEYYEREDAAQFLTREENLSELLNALREYSYSSDRAALEDLDDFLQEVALVTDIDKWAPDEQAVTLMTLHAAKGLEFPIVFLTGLEDGLFPLQNALDEPGELEEERRLFYVGATRAKDLLYLTYARNRRRWGHEIPWQRASRFLNEIPTDYVEHDGSSFVNSFEHGEENLFTASATRFKKKAKRRESPLSVEQFPLGSRVKHSQFGEGMIVYTEGRGEGLRLVVNFEEVGQKLLLASFAQLQRLPD